MENITNERLKAFVEEQFLSYPTLKSKPAASSELGGIPGLPTSYLVSPEGEVIARQVGPVTSAMVERFITSYGEKEKERGETVIALTKRLLLPLLLFALSHSVVAEVRDPSQYFFDETFGDFGEELSNAKEAGKKGILIMFELDDCPFCHRMKQTVLNQSEVQDYFKENFQIYSVDIESPEEIADFDGKRMSEKDFAFKGHRVRATPVFVFFDLEGKPVARYTGATTSLEEFMWLGEYVASGEYKNNSFTRYKRQRKVDAGTK